MTCSTTEDFLALRAMLLEDEFSYDRDTSDDIKAFWEDVASGNSRTLTATNFPLAFSTVLSKGKLNIIVRDHNGFPAFAITSDSRVVQVAATERLKEILHEAQEEELPMVYVYSSLQEFVQQLGEEGEREPAMEVTNTSMQEKSTVEPSPVRLKSALLWSHHLLATSKRKDIQHWSTELNVWAIAKIGYPGVMVFQGEEADVNEFIRRIKALQWYALQVRYEEILDSQEGMSELTMLSKCGLAEACQPAAQLRSKPCAREVESMSDLSTLMTTAKLREAFAASMKLPG